MSCNKCNQQPIHNCPCNQQEEITYICNTCPPETPCNCPIKDLSTDCVLYTGEDLTCQGTVVIPKNTILSIALKNIIDFFCQKLSEVQGYFQLINIGSGAKVYKGDNLLGQKQLRTITSTNNSIAIVEGVDTINLSAESTVPCITSDNNTVEITEVDGCINLEVEQQPICIVSPKSTVQIGEDVNGCITLDISTNVTPTASNVGGGTGIFKEFLANDYKFKTLTSTNGSVNITQPDVNTINLSIENLQKEITSNYTLTNNDDNYTILINNGVSNINITVPPSLKSKISICFIQQGSGNVSFVAGSGVTVNNPIGLVIKGQHYWAYIEQVTNTNTYQLIGSTKI